MTPEVDAIRHERYRQAQRVVVELRRLIWAETGTHPWPGERPLIEALIELVEGPQP
jgi:hypothetical protein